jgi:FAD:protein FMN transferase
LRLDAARSQAVKLDSALRLDLSSVAKGHAVDSIAAWLEEEGIEHYLFELGGELRLRGRRPDGAPWRVAIESPLETRREAFAVLSAGEALALAGSGGYRNFLELDGERVAHVIDPRSGRPAPQALASVTVVDASAARADAWATALLVLGPEEGPALAAGLSLPAYFIMRGVAGWETRATGGFARHLEGAAPQ